MGKIIYRNENLIKALYLLVFSLSLLVISADSDAVTSESELLEEAYRYYLSYEPAKAVDLLDQFLKEYPESSARDAIFFWKAKSLLQLGETDEARIIFSQLINEFPESYFRGFAEKEMADLQDEDAGPTEKTQQQKTEPFVSKEKSDEDQRLSALLDKNENLQRELHELKNRYKEAEKASSERKSESVEMTQLRKQYGEAVAQIRTLETRVAELSAVIEQVNEKKGDWKKLDRSIQELQQEKQELEEQTDKDMRQLNTDLGKLQDKYEQSRALVVQLQKEKRDLEARLQKQQSSISALKSEIDDRGRLEAELKQLEQSRQELQVRTDGDIKELRDELQKRKEQAEEYDRTIKKLRDQEMQFSDSYDNLTKLYDEKNAELETLRNSMRQYEVPVVVIDRAKYSILDIINEYTLSAAVLSKIGIPFVLWRSGNLYEDFITEQILHSKAEGEGIREDRSTVRSMSSDYGLSKNEEEYLSKYLKINKFISMHMTGDVVDDRAVRNYYEKHRDQYAVTPGVKTFHVLRLRYSETDEIDKALLAISLRQRSMNGEPLKEIQGSKPDLLVLEQMSARDVPDWVNRKIGSLQKGETSDVIVLEGAFHIFRLISEEPPVFKNYETVKDEIRKDLLLQRKIDSLPAHEWLKSIRNEAVQIR